MRHLTCCQSQEAWSILILLLLYLLLEALLLVMSLSSSIKILQVNLNRSAQATESALQVAIELKIDLILVQEPWTTPKKQDQDYSNTRSILHPGYTQLLPPYPSFRPRTLAYVSRAFSLQSALPRSRHQTLTCLL